MSGTSFSDRIFELLAKSWDRLPQLLLTLIVGFILIKLIKAFLHGLVGYSKANSALKGILLSVLDVALWIFLIAALMAQVGLTQISLALSGTVAISALALSAGSTAFVQDLVAGIFLAQDPDFNPGDRIKVDEVEGVVERMDARKIRLRDNKGVLHIFPNSHFDRSAWMVLKKR
ncbi:MAG: mechanosensitive ion channel domain-containing protein [Patescibacteria group bacterium]